MEDQCSKEVWSNNKPSVNRRFRPLRGSSGVITTANAGVATETGSRSVHTRLRRSIHMVYANVFCWHWFNRVIRIGPGYSTDCIRYSCLQRLRSSGFTEFGDCDTIVERIDGITGFTKIADEYHIVEEISGKAISKVLETGNVMMEYGEHSNSHHRI